MSSNISGSAASWIEIKKSDSIVEKSNKSVSYSEIILELDKLYTEINVKYKIKPNKNVYDSMISLKSTINALLLN